MNKIFRIAHHIVIAGVLFAISNVHAEENAGSKAGVTSQTLVKSSNSWDGSALPNYPQGTPEISVVRITVAPGAKLPLHKHPVINAGYVLSGELDVTTEQGKTLHLKAGDAVIETVNTWHSGENAGSVPAEILVFYAGVLNTPVTVTK